RRVRTRETNKSSSNLAGVGTNRPGATCRLDRRKWAQRAYAVATAQIHLGSGSERCLMGGSEELATATLEPVDSDGPQIAICLVSGGMDSCVTAAIAYQENEELAFLHVSYGQRTEQRERESFAAVADHFRVKLRLEISFEHLASIGGS